MRVGSWDSHHDELDFETKMENFKTNKLDLPIILEDEVLWLSFENVWITEHASNTQLTETIVEFGAIPMT